MALDFLRSFWPGSSQPLGGRYEIIEQLGAGGFGQTFRARDQHLPGHPLCVVKQLKPQVKSAQDLAVARRLFDTEAQVLYRLGNHPQIPRLLAHFEQNQEFYLAQELVVGYSLADKLMTAAAWSEVDVVRLISDLLRVLAFVHDHRVIHRDLKPSNLIRRHHDQRIVLIDFGAVKQASTQMVSSHTGITHTVSIGTQGYMPSEQLSGSPHFSSDVYAVGIIGIQALTGQHPRLLTPDPRTGELDWHHLRPDATAELVDIFDRMVRYDYRARYSTARQAFEAMQALPSPLQEAIPPAIPFHAAAVSRTDPGANGSPEANLADAPVDVPPTHSEAPLPMTQPDGTPPMPPSSVPTQAVFGAYGAAAQLTPEDTQPTEPASPAGAKASTTSRELTHAVAPPHRLHRSAPVNPPTPTATSIPTAIATQVLPQLSSRAARRTLWPTVAIALVLGGGLLVGRACTSQSNTAPSTAVEPTESPSLEAPVQSPSSDVAPELPQTEETQPPQTLRELLLEAQELKQAQDYNQALARYEEAIAKNESSSVAHSGRCYVLNRLTRYQDAIDACDEAIALDAGNAQALWSKGFALEQREQPQEALELYNQSLGYDPDFAEAWNNKGTALLALGNAQGALDAFDRAIEIDPDFAEAWSNRGAALWAQRQFPSARSSVERALQLRPDYPEANALLEQMQ